MGATNINRIPVGNAGLGLRAAGMLIVIYCLLNGGHTGCTHCRLYIYMCVYNAIDPTRAVPGAATVGCEAASLATPEKLHASYSMSSRDDHSAGLHHELRFWHPL